ncbi:MAG TPA: DUF362 domain-containing protein [Clostridiaceae bacterium]|nr:DUF362 domain-containing protein [Clostridiaceae bacterium]
MSIVALVRCESYEYNEVKKAVEKGLDLLGGVSRFSKEGDKILLKPNLVAADPPERCSTTNNIVFKAVAEAFVNTGAIVKYGDSPGVHSPEYAARKAKIEEAANEVGIEIADFHNGQEVFFEEGIQNKRFIIANGVVESDGLISISKFKAHGFAGITGAVKNQFGCIPGPLKGEFHAKITDSTLFAKMLVDINNLIKPRLYIMDAVYAMEGNGPRSGRPRKLNLLLFSEDPVAIDSTACRIINLNPEYVPTIVYGKEGGLGTYLQEEIQLVGDDINSFYAPDFDVKREPVRPFKQSGAIRLLKNALVPKPHIFSSKCVKCGVCVSVCPVKPKAVNWHDGIKDKPPTYVYNRCIRCFCCQELCPEGAIELKVPALRKIFKRYKY